MKLLSNDQMVNEYACGHSAEHYLCEAAMYGVGTVYAAVISAFTAGIGGIVFGLGWLYVSEAVCDKADSRER